MDLVLARFTADDSEVDETVTLHHIWWHCTHVSTLCSAHVISLCRSVRILLIYAHKHIWVAETIISNEFYNQTLIRLESVCYKNIKSLIFLTVQDNGVCDLTQLNVDLRTLRCCDQ